MAKTDEQIMEQVKSGELGCLGILFQRHHKGVYRYCYGIGRNTALAEDCVQEAFRRIIQYRHSYRGGNFRVWLHRIARNAAMDLLPDQAVEDLTERPDEAAGPAERLAQAQEGSQLQQALQVLSPAYREVILLARYSELSMREVARVLGAEEGAVRVRMHRAMKALSSAYTQQTEMEQDE